MATAEERRRAYLARKRLVQTERSLRRTTARAERLGIPAPDITPKEPLFLRLLDVLDRPEQGVFQLAESIQTGEDWQQALKDIWGGLSGTAEKVRFADLLRNAGMQDGALTTAAGFAGDVVFDPLNILPVGVTTKIGKAARIKLLATPEGRRAMTWLTEATREAPVLGQTRRLIGRMFNTRDVQALTDRPVTEQVRGYVRAVEKRMEELEKLDEPIVSIRKPETVIITSRRSPGAPIEDIPTLVGSAVPLARTNEALLTARELNDHLGVIRAMSEAHEVGRLPHDILGDFIISAKKSSLEAKQGLLTKWIPAIGTFYRKYVNPLSRKDQELVLMASEESGIASRALRHEKLRPILEQADDPTGVMRAAANHRRIHEVLEDLEDEAGIKVARLGGSLRARRETIYRATEMALQKNEFTQWRETAQAIRTTAFGSKRAQKEAFALADMLDQVGAGRVTREDVLGLMEEMPALRAGLKEFRSARLAPLSKAAREYSKRGTEIDAKNAWRVLTEDIVDTRISKGAEKHIARRDAKLKRLATLLDSVPGYVLHYMDDETVEWLGKNIGKDARLARGVGSAGHRSLLERKWVDDHGVPLSLDQVKQILTTEGDKLEGLGRSLLRRKRTWWDIMRGNPGKVGEYFGLDATSALSIRTQRTVQLISGEKFRGEVSRIFGSYPGSDGVAIAGFRGKFAPELRQIIDNMNEAYFGEAAHRTFLKFYDGAQMIWKGFTLFPFPAYHTRNAIGDLWLMTIGGFFTRETAGRGGLFEPFYRALPDHGAYLDLIRSYRIQGHLMTGNVDALQSIKLTLPSGRTMSGDELFRAMRRRGAIGIGFHSDNMRAAVDAEIKLTDAVFEGGKFNARAAARAGATVADLRTWIMPSHVPRNALIRSGKAVAEAIADSHRMALVMKRLRAGDTLDEAVGAAKKWLLDYTDLTPFETQVARRAMPFYTWLRKNLPRQIEALFDNPRKIARIGHLARFARDPNSPLQPFLSALGGEGTGLRDEDLPEPIEIPEWMRNSVPFPLRRNADGELETITIAAWHPAAELQRVAPETVGHTFVDMLSPLLKLPIETALKRNFFFDQELDGTAEFMGREMPATVANALQNVRLLAEFDRLNWFSEMGFSTRRLRPETEGEVGQRIARLFTGAKIYPLDTRMAKARNLQPILERLRIRVAKEKAARRRAKEKERARR